MPLGLGRFGANRGWRSRFALRGISSPSRPRTTLFDQFKTKTLAGFGIDDRGVEVQAAGRLGATSAKPRRRRWAISHGSSPIAGPTRSHSTR